MKQTGFCELFQDQRLLEHRTGAHPECPARLDAICQKLTGVALKDWPASQQAPTENARGNCEIDGCRWFTEPISSQLTEPQQLALETTHAAEYLHRLEQFALHGGGRWDGDTIVTPDSVEVAHLAVAIALQATQRVLTDDARAALCLLRPPGHHASRDNAMGFCLLNNIAVAARYAIQQFGLERVLIVDWDVHHGNGTQDIFYEDAQVWFFSAHRAPFYPGTGAATETGAGPGDGTTCNVPFPADVSRTDYLERFQKEITAFADRCEPELILISAGFDAHHRDPIGSLGLQTTDFATLTKIVQTIANKHCTGRIVSLLEGGYHLEALAESVEIHAKTMAAN